MVRHRKPFSLDFSNWPEPELPDNYYIGYKDVGPDQQEYTEKMHRSKLLHQYYLGLTRRYNPKHWTALQLYNEVRVQPVQIVQQVWESNTTFFLRQALIRIVNN